MPGDFGANTSTVAAVCSTATLVGGGFAYTRHSRRERRAQALQVAGWLTERPPTESDQRRRSVVACIENGSDVPITNVRAWFSRMITEEIRFGILRPGEKQEIEASEEFLPAWAPNSVDLIIVFTDASGMVWLRSPNGKVRRVRRLRGEYHPYQNSRGGRRWGARHLSTEDVR